MSVIINKKSCFCISVVILSLLAGCEMMNSDYDCPLSASASCMPLHVMDSAVSQGLYPKEDNQRHENNQNNENNEHTDNNENNPLNAGRGINFNTNQNANNNINNNNVYNQADKNLVIGAHPKRTHEMVAKIWLAPFIDSKGDYYEQSVVYAVVKNSVWVNLPIKEVTVKQ